MYGECAYGVRETIHLHFTFKAKFLYMCFISDVHVYVTKYCMHVHVHGNFCGLSIYLFFVVNLNFNFKQPLMLFYNMYRLWPNTKLTL